MFGIKANEKNVIVRPEDFIISSNSENDVRGIVQKISFWGSFDEVKVGVDEFTIIVRAVKNEWRIGKEVNVISNITIQDH